jgi:hypothetical protein
MQYTIEDVRYYMQYPAMIEVEIQRLDEDISDLKKRDSESLEVPSYIKASQLRHTPTAKSVDSKIEYIVIQRISYIQKLENIKQQWITFDRAIRFIRKSLYNTEKAVIDLRYIEGERPYTFEYIACKLKHSQTYIERIENSICKRILHYYNHILVK